MSREELLERVKAVVTRVLGIEPNLVGDNSNFVFDLGASSMQSMLLVAAFEEEFGIQLPEDKALEAQNIADACDFIADHLPSDITR
jgi:acyl carrier protein